MCLLTHSHTALESPLLFYDQCRDQGAEWGVAWGCSLKAWPWHPRSTDTHRQHRRSLPANINGRAAVEQQGGWWGWKTILYGAISVMAWWMRGVGVSRQLAAVIDRGVWRHPYHTSTPCHRSACPLQLFFAILYTQPLWIISPTYPPTYTYPYSIDQLIMYIGKEYERDALKHYYP